MRQISGSPLSSRCGANRHGGADHAADCSNTMSSSDCHRQHLRAARRASIAFTRPGTKRSSAEVRSDKSLVISCQWHGLSTQWIIAFCDAAGNQYEDLQGAAIRVLDDDDLRASSDQSRI